MAQIIYRVVKQADMSYGVEQCSPRLPPVLVKGFQTEAAALAWVDNRRRLAARRQA